jgi:hypothetical protein
VARIPDRVADRHFKSQSADLTWRGQRVVEFVGHMERLAADWQELAARHDLPPALERAHTTRAKGPHEDWRAYYDRATVHLVAERYRTDLAELGYEGARDELLAYVG